MENERDGGGESEGRKAERKEKKWRKRGEGVASSAVSVLPEEMKTELRLRVTFKGTRP